MARDANTVVQRFRTQNPNIIKVIIGEVGPGKLIFAKSIYFEVMRGEEKLLALDFESALAALIEAT